MLAELLVTAFALAVSQDTIIVRADNRPVWGNRVRITRELRIGEVEGAPE